MFEHRFFSQSVVAIVFVWYPQIACEWNESSDTIANRYNQYTFVLF